MAVRATQGQTGRVRTGRIGAQGPGGAGGVSPAFQADFTALSSLPTGVSFSRATTGTRFNSSGVNVTEAIDTPRFDYAWNGSAWVAVGLLIEEQRTNLLLNSGGSWGNTPGANITVTTGVADPAGTNTALTLTATASGAFNDQNYYYKDLTSLTSGSAYTGSLWIRRRTGTGNVSFFAGSTVAQNNRTLTSSWQRFDQTQTLGSTTAFLQLDILTSGDAIDVAFGQLEAGSFATSYIPTTLAAVTRSADIVSLTGTPLTALQGASGSVFVEVNEVNPSGGPAYLLSPIGSGDFATAYNTPAANPGHVSFYNGAVIDNAAGSGPAVDWTQPVRAGVAWDGISTFYTANGASPTDAGTTAGIGASITAAHLGSASGGAWINGHARSIAVYSSKLSNADLQTKSVVGAAF